MPERPDPVREALTDALVAALRRLGTAGEPVEASRLAARAYAATRRDAPRLAERLNGVMHHLARLEAATHNGRSHHVTDAQILDVRQEPPIRRHGLIFETFDHLPVGASFELVNDHDPKPLYYQLAAEQGGTFSWDYLEQGPVVWRVRIGRTAAAGAVASPDRGEELEMAGPGTAS